MTKFYNLSSNSDKNTLSIAINDDIGSFFGTNSEEFARVLKDNPNVANVDVEINSFGGSLFDGISMFNQLKEHSATVTTSITGLAASAASLIFMAGDKREVNTGAFLMIHKPTAGAFADADSMRDIADNLDQFQESIVDIYASQVNITRDEINDMVNAETWINGIDAVDMGFATDQSEDVAEVENKFDFVEYKNNYTSEVPEDAKKYFKNKNVIQQVLNKLRNVLNINPITEEEDDMNKEEIQAMLAEKLGEQKTEFSNQLDGVKTDFQDKLTEKDEVISGLTSKITDLQNKAAVSSIENIVDGFIAEFRISPANREFEIENLKLREGQESFETYKNSIASREPVVNMEHNLAHGGVSRNSTTGIDSDIEKILNEANGSMETSSYKELIDAAKKAGGAK